MAIAISKSFKVCCRPILFALKELKKNNLNLYSNEMSSLCSIRQEALDVAMGAISSVSPNQMIQNAIRVGNEQLIVKERVYQINKNVYIAAFGKAVLGMVKAVEDILGEHIVEGIASVPFGMREVMMKNDFGHLLPLNSNITIYEGAKFNLPDEDCLMATQKICSMAANLSKDDILLVLISGGGSSLFTSPQMPLNLDDVIRITKGLSARGATITQLNMLRRHLSSVKGGRFALMAHPANVVALILSDVLGDALEAIASGPTVPDLSTS